MLSPDAEIGKYLRLYLGGKELINNQKRFCLWLKDAEPSELKKFPIILDRIALVKKFHLESIAKSTKNFAKTPTLFAQIAQLDSDYLAIPEVSSERRIYIPIGFLTKDVIASNKLQMLPNATLLLFGILTSEIHMSWVRNICGRLKSDFSYSNSLVYNNFPFPENSTDRQIKTIEEKAQKVLDTRAEFPNSSLADLYDPLTMPPELVKAHNELDKPLTWLTVRNRSPMKQIEWYFYLNFIKNIQRVYLQKRKQRKGEKLTLKI